MQEIFIYADIDKSITERIDYAIVGKFYDSVRLQKLKDFGIKTFSEEEIIKINPPNIWRIYFLLYICSVTSSATLV